MPDNGSEAITDGKIGLEIMYMFGRDDYCIRSEIFIVDIGKTILDVESKIDMFHLPSYTELNAGIKAF